jgi:hypothetical protein
MKLIHCEKGKFALIVEQRELEIILTCLRNASRIRPMSSSFDSIAKEMVDLIETQTGLS